MIDVVELTVFVDRVQMEYGSIISIKLQITEEIFDPETGNTTEVTKTVWQPLQKISASLINENVPAGDDNFDLLQEQYGENYFPVMGGATIGLRAVHLFRMLGFPKFEMYGFDSCITDSHHAYEQPENDDEGVIDVNVSGKEFRCTAAHYHQAKEFVDMISKTGEHYDLAVHGNGLI